MQIRLLYFLLVWNEILPYMASSLGLFVAQITLSMVGTLHFICSNRMIHLVLPVASWEVIRSEFWCVSDQFQKSKALKELYFIIRIIVEITSGLYLPFSPFIFFLDGHLEAWSNLMSNKVNRNTFRQYQAKSQI